MGSTVPGTPKSDRTAVTKASSTPHAPNTTTPTGTTLSVPQSTPITSTVSSSSSEILSTTAYEDSHLGWRTTGIVIGVIVGAALLILLICLLIMLARKMTGKTSTYSLDPKELAQSYKPRGTMGTFFYQDI